MKIIPNGQGGVIIDFEGLVVDASAAHGIQGISGIGSLFDDSVVSGIRNVNWEFAVKESKNVTQER